MPAPPISIQPDHLHVRQPLPPQIPHETSGSIEGSVNGKKWVRKRTRRSGPYSARMMADVPTADARVLPGGTILCFEWGKVVRVAERTADHDPLPGWP